MLSSIDTNKETLSARSEWLDFLWLELTEKCNLSCQHCYVSSSPNLPLFRRMAHENWLDAIREASALGCKSLQFIGGEPILYPRLDELIVAARNEQMDFVEIYTNGTPLSEKWVRKLRDYEVNVACSVYAAEARIHDSVTQKPGSFARTIAALQRLVQSRVPVRVGFIEMSANAGTFDETRRFLAAIGIDDVQHDFERGFGRAAQRTKNTDPFSDLCGQCWKGRLCITSTGDAYPCIMSRSFKMGNVIDDGLAATVRSNELRSFRLDMMARSGCSHAIGTDGKLSEEGNSTDCRPDKPECRPTRCKPENPDPTHCRPERCKPIGYPCRPENPCTPQIA